MSIGEQRFVALRKEAVDFAMDTIKKNKAGPLSHDESLILELGVAAGIKIMVKEFFGEEGSHAPEPPSDHFAE